jgi:hypothetical protein
MAVEVASSVTVAVVPASVVVTVPIFIEGVLPSLPSLPAGIVKSNILFVEVEEVDTLTDAVLPGVPVVTVPMETLALTPSCPSTPRGKAKLSVAFCESPLLVTSADPPAFLVTTVPIAIVAADPEPPETPVFPRGNEKFNILLDAVEAASSVTVAVVPASVVVIVPI